MFKIEVDVYLGALENIGKMKGENLLTPQLS